MSLVGIESVTYGVEDLAQAATFFEDFGLTVAERANAGLTLTTPESTSLNLRAVDDPSLPAAMEPGSTVREIMWGVDSPESLDALAADLATDRPVVTDAEGAIHTVDPTGYGIAFRVTRRTPVRLTPQTLNTVGEAVRHNARFRAYERAAPQHIGHIVLYHPDLEPAVDFYTRRLGFMVSDRLTNFGAFLRCSTDHHNLFLLRHGRTGLNHLSFGVQGVDEIMGGFAYLSKRGYEPVWGLGRHYIGSNLFYYFRNPAGAYVEYYADMDCITDPAMWTPGEFSPGQPEALFAWGGYPPKEFGR